MIGYRKILLSTTVACTHKKLENTGKVSSTNMKTAFSLSLMCVSQFSSSKTGNCESCLLFEGRHTHIHTYTHHKVKHFEQ